MFEGWLGQALSALVAAGAFAAFLSTASGLSVSVAGVLSQDLLRHDGRLGDGVRRFRLGTVVAVLVPFLLALVAGRANLAQTVTLAFAVAASTFCPLLVLGIWWPRLTTRGALAALWVGGGTALAAVVLCSRQGRSPVSPARCSASRPRGRCRSPSSPPSWSRCARVTGCRRTADAAMTRLHAPEELETRIAAARETAEQQGVNGCDVPGRTRAVRRAARPFGAAGSGIAAPLGSP